MPVKAYFVTSIASLRAPGIAGMRAPLHRFVEKSSERYESKLYPSAKSLLIYKAVQQKPHGIYVCGIRIATYAQNLGKTQPSQHIEPSMLLPVVTSIPT